MTLLTFSRMLFYKTIFIVWQSRKSKRYYILVCYVFYPENLIIILEYKDGWCLRDYWLKISGTTDLVTWLLKHKLVALMEYTDAWFIQQVVRRIECLKHVYLCMIQETKSWYAKHKMQNRIFQSSAKFMHGKKQNTNLI